MLYQAAYDAEGTDPQGFRRPITPFSKTQPIGVSLADHYAAFAAE